MTFDWNVLVLSRFLSRSQPAGVLTRNRIHSGLFFPRRSMLMVRRRRKTSKQMHSNTRPQRVALVGRPARRPRQLLTPEARVGRGCGRRPTAANVAAAKRGPLFREWSLLARFPDSHRNLTRHSVFLLQARKKSDLSHGHHN